MADSFATMTGRIQCNSTIGALADQLTARGLRVEVRKRLCSTSDEYIRIHEGDDFTLQTDSRGGYQAEGVSTTVEEMFVAASRVSSRLTEIDIRHRFEVRDERFRLVHYLHHLWPPQEEPILNARTAYHVTGSAANPSARPASSGGPTIAWRCDSPAEADERSAG